MSKRSIDFRRNRKKVKRSSPGRTPKPLGRVRMNSNIPEIIEKLNPNRQCMSESASQSLRTRLQARLQPIIQFQKELQQQEVEEAKQRQRNNIKNSKVRSDSSKSDQCSINEKLTVKQRAQMFEQAAKQFTKSNDPKMIQKPKIQPKSSTTRRLFPSQQIQRGLSSSTPMLKYLKIDAESSDI
ncbi:unnamed protein product [Thelazia callipaeda]|uniref:Uncharacterized protein n=1 Tax=Thelazia callipaeda TaxID=103827 RepID=A0A0N5DB23_THECL|nr:unnamed protein product [Thelazia callipaeda]